MTIDDQLLSLAKKLKINRSEAAEKGIKMEIALKLKTVDLDVENFKMLAEEYLIESKRQDEKILLAGQRLEQQEYVKTREKELQAELDQTLLHEWHNFCAGHHLTESEFVKYVLGEDYFQKYAPYEDLLADHLKRKDLPDLNHLRQVLKAKVPIKAVIR